MATFKKTSTAKKSTRKTARGPAPQPEAVTRSLSESAQQIWLAGVGAFNRAQAEGTRLFEGLVKEGMSLEQHARRLAGGQADVVRDAVETRVGQAKERAADTWDRLESVFEDRVQRALVKLGVPNRNDLNDLSRQVDALTAELRRLNAQDAGKAAPAAAAKPARKATAVRKARVATTSKPAAARKSVRRPKSAES